MPVADALPHQGSLLLCFPAGKLCQLTQGCAVKEVQLLGASPQAVGTTFV